MENKSIPLCVDLDGTLVYNDTVQESIMQLLKYRFLYVFVLPFWLLKGHAYVKRKIVSLIQFDPSHLPYNQAMIEYIKEEKKKGRKIVLATASDQVIAESVANYLGLFDEVIGSDGHLSYAGKHKLAKLNKEYKKSGFVYAGNSTVDLSVWPNSKEVVVVTSSPSLLKKVKRFGKPIIAFPGRTFSYKDLVSFLHIKRWWSSSIVFLALFFYPINRVVILSCLGAYIILSFMTSAIGIVSDLVNHENDRKDPVKKHWPFASGKVSVKDSLIVSVLLIVTSILASCFYPVYFTSILCLYFVISLVYCFSKS